MSLEDLFEEIREFEILSKKVTNIKTHLLYEKFSAKGKTDNRTV